MDKMIWIYTELSEQKPREISAASKLAADVTNDRSPWWSCLNNDRATSNLGQKDKGRSFQFYTSYCKASRYYCGAQNINARRFRIGVKMSEHLAFENLGVTGILHYPSHVGSGGHSPAGRGATAARARSGNHDHSLRLRVRVRDFLRVRGGRHLTHGRHGPTGRLSESARAPFRGGRAA